MIVEMSRVIVLGPKRLLAKVIDAVQRLGTLHIDRIESEEAPAVQPLQIGDDEAKALQAVERAVARLDGVLTLLPPVSADTSGESVMGTVDELDAEAAQIEQKVREITRTRLEREEERTLIASYESAVRVLSPLLTALSTSRAFESIGFILNTKDLTVVAGLHNELKKITGGRVEVVSHLIEEQRIGVVVAFLRQDGERVRSVLSRAGVTELRLPARFTQERPQDTVALMERRRTEIPAEIARLDAELAAISRTARSRLMGIRAYLADRLAQMKVVPELAQSRYTFIVHGWTPSRAVGEIRSVLRGQFGAEIVVYDTPADPHDAPERVPVMLDNHPLVRPIQRLLALFQPPRYGAWDPSPVMAITFPIFVGLVIGDVGYGLLLFLLGWSFRNKARAGQTVRVPLVNLRLSQPVLADASFLIRICAVWMIVFGVIYAEVFGNLPELLWHVEPIFNRVQETDQYFLLIISGGILMIFLGLFVHFVQALRHRHTVGVFESAVIMFGTAGLLLFLGARGAILPAGLSTVGLYVFLAAVAMAAVSLVVDRDVMKRFLWLLESTAAFGHILSHARLMAFGLAAAALATAANELGRQAGGVGIVVGILVGAFWQGLFFIFTIFGHIIQPARLHWVEFFSKFKFHEETGPAYRPFQKSATAHRR